MLTIGVLALQGAIKEHLDRLQSLPQVKGILVKTTMELEDVDGLILPGGESTAMGKLLREFDLLEPLTAKIKAGLPVWGTCAGMILLAKSISGQPDNHLGVMNICVQRNGYGSQLDSFSVNTVLPDIANTPIPLVFIRAPYVESVGQDVKILAKIDDKIVAVEQDNMLATAFHPELTSDLTFHKYFADKVRKAQTA
ncbi:glutamine amidotransferase [Anaerosporomusa subterranea]|uniref:Pyridoxal 5'-phosphate synthase subunit PdxT n=1 Tax=Anaerosporomusa subterranea TaxID=1794912 RepID=A0A154BM25_ANASB|nr:pyridoxal 5'-phosphate synthase glutaminase subunit PdxT [Anaerosporomusa subterranea]KYZ74951.1 glutamine amidotransferase [Anaerosporomusa subterranea]